MNPWKVGRVPIYLSAGSTAPSRSKVSEKHWIITVRRGRGVVYATLAQFSATSCANPQRKGRRAIEEIFAAVSLSVEDALSH